MPVNASKYDLSRQGERNDDDPWGLRRRGEGETFTCSSESMSDIRDVDKSKGREQVPW